MSPSPPRTAGLRDRRACQDQMEIHRLKSVLPAPATHLRPQHKLQKGQRASREPPLRG